MKVRKENKIYTIDERQKASYLDLGYDVINETTGDIVEHSPLKSISYAEHLRLIQDREDKNIVEFDNLNTTITEKDAKITELEKNLVAKMTIEELKTFANEREIAIPEGVTKADDIRAFIETSYFTTK